MISEIANIIEASTFCCCLGNFLKLLFIPAISSETQKYLTKRS